MREIKFRAWNGKELFNVDVLAISPCTWDCPDYGKRGVSIAYQPHIQIMQYTGLKDKNGKEIYEGDILKEDDIITEIVFENLTWQEKLISSPRNHLSDYFPLNQNTTRTSLFGEVIGNVYENPELLIQ